MPRTLLSVTRHPGGHRVHVLDCRVHHAIPGLIAVVLGLIAVWRDRSDFPWLSD